MIQFGMLQIEQIDAYWEEAKDLLLPSFRDVLNTHTAEHYYPGLKSGSNQMWFAMEDEKIIGVVVTSLSDEPLGRVCFIHSLAGSDLKEWVEEMDKQLTEFANLNNCIAIEAVTRKGFARFVPNWIEDGVIYVKMLEKNT